MERNGAAFGAFYSGENAKCAFQPTDKSHEISAGCDLISGFYSIKATRQPGFGCLCCLMGDSGA
jgi:hypothetical protein